MANKVLCVLILGSLLAGFCIHPFAWGLLFSLTALLWLLSLAVFTDTAFEHACSHRNVADLLAKSAYVVCTDMILLFGNRQPIPLVVVSVFLLLLVLDLAFVKLPYRQVSGSRVYAQHAVGIARTEYEKYLDGLPNDLRGNATVRAQRLRSLSFVTYSVVTTLLFAVLGVIFGRLFHNLLLLCLLSLLISILLWRSFYEMLRYLRPGRLCQLLCGISGFVLPAALLLAPSLTGTIDGLADLQLPLYVLGIGGGVTLLMACVKASQTLSKMLNEADA